jgi:hypothetical protein
MQHMILNQSCFVLIANVDAVPDWSQSRCGRPLDAARILPYNPEKPATKSVSFLHRDRRVLCAGTEVESS